MICELQKISVMKTACPACGNNARFDVYKTKNGNVMFAVCDICEAQIPVRERRRQRNPSLDGDILWKDVEKRFGKEDPFIVPQKVYVLEFLVKRFGAGTWQGVKQQARVIIGNIKADCELHWWQRIEDGFNTNPDINNFKFVEDIKTDVDVSDIEEMFLRNSNDDE